MRIEFPYYQSIPGVEVPDENLIGVLGPSLRVDERSEQGILDEAFARPIGGPPLRDLAQAGQRVVLITDDNTRPTPAARILPRVLAELDAAGVREQDLTVLVALGSHRPMTQAELADKLGAGPARRLRIVQPDSRDATTLRFWGNTSLDVPIWADRTVEGADLVIGIGAIMPLMAAGFTGGGKIVVPGICGEQTNDAMHWAGIEIPERNLFGQRENPVRAMIDEVSQSIGLHAIVNVVVGEAGRIVGAVTGHPVAAHRRGCELARQAFGVHAPEAADVVLADSYPFDIEFWQANKALDGAGLVVKPGGTIVLIAPCPEGVSATHPEIVQYGYRPVEEIRRLVHEGRLSRTVGVHMIQVARVAVERATCVLVSDGISAQAKDELGFVHVPTPAEGLAWAFARHGAQARALVLRRAAQLLPLDEDPGGAPA